MSPQTRAIFLLFLASIFPAAIAQSVPAAQPAATSDPCALLAQLKIPAATIAQAQIVPSGTFSGPPAAFTGTDLSLFYKSLPAFCRVVADAKPTPDSDIKLEIWLPASGWNGKLQGIGNGGFAGQIDYYQIGAAMMKGYVSTATDTGHAGAPGDAAWAMGHPEKVVDFGYRGIHEMTRIAKLLAQSFYGSAPKHSYFAGCSDGGREALMEAQRYPTDYDGILAGAPANYWSALQSMAVADTQALTLDPASFIPPSKIPVIAAAVLAQCDELDGVRDGILNDPRQCHFDPASIQCKAADDTSKCLTGAQATALKTIYDGLRDSQAHAIFPGFLPGAEEGPGGWGFWITGPAPARSVMAFLGQSFYSNMVYEKTDWGYKTFTVSSGTKAAEDRTGVALDATDPNLKSFSAAGGKLILYHGWQDPAIPGLSTIKYYDSVVSTMGEPTTDSFLRLYMLPGVQHCVGGPGPSSFGGVGDWLSPDDPQHNVRFALEQWVEKGTAPGTIIATKPADVSKQLPRMTRPLCAYPAAAKYKGSGDTYDAANFTCVK